MGTTLRAAGASAAVALALLVFAPPAAALPSIDTAVGSSPACAEQPFDCDVDSDGIADLVEEAICGSATCATGDEDLDGDGVPDAVALSESLESGGPGGPVQFPSVGEVLVVLPDGRLTQFAWWPIAAAALLAASAAAFAFVVRRRSAR